MNPPPDRIRGYQTEAPIVEELEGIRERMAAISDEMLREAQHRLEAFAIATNATTAGTVATDFTADTFAAVFGFMQRFEPWAREPNPFRSLALRYGMNLHKGDWILLPLNFFEHAATRPLLEHIATPGVFLFPWHQTGDLLLIAGEKIKAPAAEEWQIVTLLPGGYVETDCRSGRQRMIRKKTGKIAFGPPPVRRTPKRD